MPKDSSWQWWAASGDSPSEMSLPLDAGPGLSLAEGKCGAGWFAEIRTIALFIQTSRDPKHNKKVGVGPVLLLNGF